MLGEITGQVLSEKHVVFAFARCARLLFSQNVLPAHTKNRLLRDRRFCLLKRSGAAGLPYGNTRIA